MSDLKQALVAEHTLLRQLEMRNLQTFPTRYLLPEILALSDRVLVMNQGRIAGELPIADCSEAALGLLMTGGNA